MRRATVNVFPLAVVSQFDDWPEQGQREQRWHAPAEAAAAVDEPELKAILAAFREPPKTTGLAGRALTWARDGGGRKFPMPRWFQALMPNQGRFFKLFEAHAATLVAAADALARLLQGGPEMAEHCRTIHDRRHEAEDITRDLLQDVYRSVVTPFDQGAITVLIGKMDDAVDRMNKAATSIMQLDLAEFEPGMRDVSGIIVEAARITAEAVPLLRSVGGNAGRLRVLAERVVRIEGHAEEIRDAGLKALRKGRGGSATRVIVGREIYDHLEAVVDSFEDVANEIRGLVVNHA